MIVFFALWVTVAIAGVNEDLYKATERGELSDVKSSIAKGADVNSKMSGGITALMIASQKGYK